MVGSFSVTPTIGQLAAGFLRAGPGAAPDADRPGDLRGRQLPDRDDDDGAALIAFRAMSGLGGGMTLISERLYIARVTAGDRLAFVNGVVSAAGSTRLGRSGRCSGPCSRRQTLRAPFIVVGCTATIAGIAALLFLPPEPDGTRPLGQSPIEAAAGARRSWRHPSSAAAASDRQAEAHASRWTARPAAHPAGALERRLQRGLRRLDHDVLGRIHDGQLGHPVERRRPVLRAIRGRGDPAGAAARQACGPDRAPPDGRDRHGARLPERRWC